MRIKHALFHNTGWKIIAMLFNFLNNIIIVRMLGVEASANFFYIVALLTFISTVLRLGLENGIIYFLSKKPERAKAIAMLLLIVMAIQSIITILCLPYFDEKLFGYSFLWCVLFVITNVLVYYVSAFYQVKKMYKSLNVSGCIMVLCQTLLLYYLYKFSNVSSDNLFLKSKNNTVFIISSVTILIQMLFLCFFFYKIHKADFHISLKEKNIEKSIFRFSIMNFGITVLFFLILRADLYFVEKYCSKTVFGNYVQATKIGQMLLIFPGLIAGVIFPYTINAAEAVASKVAMLCRLLTVVFFAGFIIFLLTGSVLFTWLLGKDFYLIYSIFNTYFLGVYFLSLNLLFVAYFEGINNQKIIFITFALIFLIIVVADYFLVSIYGYFAASVIFSVANFIGVIILLKAFIIKTRIKINEILLFRLADLKLLNIK